MKTGKMLKTTLLAVGAFALGSSAFAQEWPTRPIEISVWASAGGGTDTTNRFLAEAMAEELGTRINVTNRTGGGGGVAMNHVWTQPRDGHSILGASEAMQVVKVMKYHETGTSDWRWYIVAGAPGVISVRENSPYRSLDDLIAAAKANPGSVSVGHCAIGCVWHMKALALGQGADVNFNYIPFEGSAPAQVAALSGEVDAVVSGIAEQSEFIRSGRYRPLAMIEMETYDFPGVGVIEAAGAKFPGITAIPARQWLGMAIPKDIPAAAVERIDAAFVKAMEHPKIKSLATDRYFLLYGQYGEEAEAILQEMENVMSWKLFELGVAETSPDTLGIARP